MPVREAAAIEVATPELSTSRKTSTGMAAAGVSTEVATSVTSNGG